MNDATTGSSPDKLEFDVTTALESPRYTGSLVAWLLLIGLALAFDAFDNQLLGLWVPAIAVEFGVGSDAFSTVFASGLVGLSLGAVVGGGLADMLGRRLIMILSVALFAAASIATSFANSMEGLLVTRFIGGLGLGALYPVALTLAAELVPPRHRSTVIMCLVACIPIGGMLAGIASAIAPPALGWRDLFMIGGVVPGVLLVPMIFVLPESPPFLLSRPEKHDKLRLLLRRMGLVVAENARLVGTVGAKERMPVSAIFARDIRRDTIAISVAFFVSMLVSYSLQNWLPTVLDTLGLDAARRGTSMAVVYAGGLLGMLAGAFLLPRMGSRRLLLLLGAGSVIITLALVVQASGVRLSEPLLVLLLALQALFLGTLQAGLYSLAAHVFPTTMRSTGVGTANGIGRLGAILSAFTAAFSLSVGGPVGLFFSLSLFLLVVTFSIHAISRHIPAIGADHRKPEPLP